MIVVTESYLHRVLGTDVYQSVLEVMIDGEPIRYVHEEKLYSEKFLEVLREREKVIARRYVIEQIRKRIFGD